MRITVSDNRCHFWVCEFKHSLGWTPTNIPSLTRGEARQIAKEWRAKMGAWKFRVVKYVRDSK